MQRILFAFYLLLSGSVISLASTGVSVTGYDKVSNNAAVIKTNDGGSLLIKLCSPSIIKIHRSFDGSFPEGCIEGTFRPTPAVVREEIVPVTLEINESNSNLEIFTSEVRICIDKSPFKLKLYDTYQKLLVSDADEAYLNENGNITCSKILAQGEEIFGLGEKGGRLSRTGQTFKMWNSDKPCYCISEDPLYKSIPFFLSNRGYGIFFDNSYKTVFDFGDRKQNCYSFSAPGGEMEYYIIVGKEYKDIITKYADLTGHPVMPPKWALGFSQCGGLYRRVVQAREVAAKFRELQIPCDIIYQDIGWTEFLQNFEWRPGNYTNPTDMTKTLHDMGFHIIVSQNPVISQENSVQWEEGNRLGLFVKDIRTGKTYDMPWPWGGNCAVVDFTNPNSAKWWGDYQQKAIDDGVDGFWTDMGEPAWSNEEETDRLNMIHAEGPHDKIHNVYGLYWDKVVTEQFNQKNPNKRLFQMTRSAFSGMQRYAFSWTGDSGSSKAMTDSWEQFSYQIPMMLSAGLACVPFITGDITGYCGSIEDYEAAAELYVRWMQFGLFTPLSRSHHEGDTAVEPWMFGNEAMSAAKKAIELKYSLMPYIYTYAREAYDLGLPLMRAMMLEFPKDSECIRTDFQFMFGAELLVAPVIEEGQVTREVYFPKGKWYDYYTHKIIDGGSYREVPAPLDRTPLFVRAGSIVPTCAPMQYTSQNPEADINIDVYPQRGKKAQFTLYEDDGESLDYQRAFVLKERFRLC